MRAKALFMALSRKLKDGEILFVDSFGIPEPKTALAKKALASLASISGFERLNTKKRNAALVALADPAEAVVKSFNNIGSVTCIATRNLNPVAILKATYLILENPEAAVKIVERRAAKHKHDPKK